MSKIGFYIYYDKNGAFLGALKKVGKPTDANCKRVSEKEYNEILAVNRLPQPATAIEEPVVSESTETNEESTESEVE